MNNYLHMPTFTDLDKAFEYFVNNIYDSIIEKDRILINAVYNYTNNRGVSEKKKREILERHCKTEPQKFIFD